MPRGGENKQRQTIERGEASCLGTSYLLLVDWLNEEEEVFGNLLEAAIGGGVWLLGSIFWCIINLVWGKRIAKQP